MTRRRFILRERERERERECVCACVLFYNTKLWTQFYISGLPWEQGWLRSVCASSQYDQTLPFFRISSEMGVHTYDTLAYRKYKKNNSNFMWRGIIMRKYPYIKLYLSISNIYIALSIKHAVSRTRLSLSLFQNLWFYSSMNVLFRSYHVTAIPSLNHSLLDAWLK